MWWGGTGCGAGTGCAGAAGHVGWVWAAAHNPYHDQLVLSAGSDRTLRLWDTSDLVEKSAAEVDGNGIPAGASPPSTAHSRVVSGPDGLR